MEENSSEQKPQVTSVDVSIRPFARADILPVVDYWTGNSEEFWRQRGVDKAKFKSRDEFIAGYEKSFLEKGGIPTLVTILLNGEAVGIHGVSDIVQGESAVMHAHIWREEHRHRGIGIYSYLKAAEHFFNAFDLKKIIFKTPKVNQGPNRVKEKIGIPAIGETVFDAPMMMGPVQATLYELDRELLQVLKARHKI